MSGWLIGFFKGKKKAYTEAEILEFLDRLTWRSTLAADEVRGFLVFCAERSGMDERSIRESVAAIGMMDDRAVLSSSKTLATEYLGRLKGIEGERKSLVRRFICACLDAVKDDVGREQQKQARSGTTFLVAVPKRLDECRDADCAGTALAAQLGLISEKLQGLDRDFGKERILKLFSGKGQGRTHKKVMAASEIFSQGHSEQKRAEMLALSVYAKDPLVRALFAEEIRLLDFFAIFQDVANALMEFRKLTERRDIREPMKAVFGILLRMRAKADGAAGEFLGTEGFGDFLCKELTGADTANC